MPFRPCGDCNACCEGHLLGTAYGNTQAKGVSCRFLVDKKCSIYSTRPGFCAKYQCAWSQNLLDESMRPDQCGLLVTVQKATENENPQLLAVEIWNSVPWDSYVKLNESVKNLETQWILQKHHELQP